MRERHVAHEGANDFVIAHAAMQPSQKNYELNANRNDGSKNGEPRCGHGNSLARRRSMLRHYKETQNRAAR
jgi:hypothetical protein